MNPLATFARAPAAAVGAGITATIRAHAVSREQADSPEAWVHFCCTAADEAHHAVLESPPFRPREAEGSAMRLLRKVDPEGYAELNGQDAALVGQELAQAAHQAALVAFRACMPKLTGRRSTQAYIACVAAGVQRGYFTGSESKALLYTAQLALSAYPSRRAPRGRK